MSLLDPVKLVHTIASWLVGSAIEKQGLLEAPDVEQRAEMLRGVLQFHRAERSARSETGTVH